MDHDLGDEPCINTGHVVGPPGGSSASQQRSSSAWEQVAADHHRRLLTPPPSNVPSNNRSAVPSCAPKNAIPPSVGGDGQRSAPVPDVCSWASSLALPDPLVSRHRPERWQLRGAVRLIVPPRVHALCLGILHVALLAWLIVVVAGGLVAIALPISVILAEVAWNLLKATLAAVAIYGVVVAILNHRKRK